MFTFCDQGVWFYEKHDAFPDLYYEVYEWLIRDEDHKVELKKADYSSAFLF